MSVYIPTDWEDGTTWVNAANLDKLEAGVAGAVQKPAATADREFPVWDQASGSWQRSTSGLIKIAASGMLIGDVLLGRDDGGPGLTVDGYLTARGGLWGVGAPGDETLGIYVAADIYSRFLALGSGELRWGPGGSTPSDTNLYRLASGLLYIDGTFGSAAGIYSLGDITARDGSAQKVLLGNHGGLPGIVFGEAGDASLYRLGANYLGTDGSILVGPGGVYNAFNKANWYDVVLQAALAGDPQIRFWISADGHLTWGPGDVAPDVNLYRSAADQLKTDDSLIVAGGLALGAQTPGAAGSLKFGDGTVQSSAAAALPARLGGNAELITDWNAVVSNGWYISSGNNNGPTNGEWWIGEVVAHNASWVTQEVWCFTDGWPAQRRYRRQYVSGVWQPWVKVPFMAAGTQFFNLDENSNAWISFGVTFNSPPVVIVTNGDGNTSNQDAQFGVDDVTTSQFLLHLQWNPSGAGIVNWQAIALW